MPEPLLKAVKRRSVFLPSFFVRETDMWRKPHTQQERRVCCNPEYRQLGVRIRGKRSLRNLVHAFLDLPRQRQRSWKEQRRTQYYKVKEIPPPCQPEGRE